MFAWPLQDNALCVSSTTLSTVRPTAVQESLLLKKKKKDGDQLGLWFLKTILNPLQGNRAPWKIGWFQACGRKLSGAWAVVLCWKARKLSGTNGSGQRDTRASKGKTLLKKRKEMKKKGEIEPMWQNLGNCLIWVAGVWGSFYYSFSYFIFFYYKIIYLI